MSLKSALYAHLKGANVLTCTADAGTDFITATAHGRLNGDKVWFATTNTLPAGLSVETDYFVIGKTANTFQVATTKGGAAVDITDTGTGTHTVGTAVTNQIADRIYAGQAEQNATTPYIVYSIISEERFPHTGGPSGLVKSRVQFDCYDPSPLTVLNMVTALRLWLDGFNQLSMGSELLDVRMSMLENVSDVFVAPFDADESGLHQTSVDFMFVYAESVPAH